MTKKQGQGRKLCARLPRTTRLCSSAWANLGSKTELFCSVSYLSLLKLSRSWGHRMRYTSASVTPSPIQTIEWSPATFHICAPQSCKVTNTTNIWILAKERHPSVEKSKHLLLWPFPSHPQNPRTHLTSPPSMSKPSVQTSSCEPFIPPLLFGQHSKAV